MFNNVDYEEVGLSLAFTNTAEHLNASNIQDKHPVSRTRQSHDECIDILTSRRNRQARPVLYGGCSSLDTQMTNESKFTNGQKGDI